MSSLAKALSLDAVQRLSSAAKLNATGLVLTVAGMLLQIGTGSALNPVVGLVGAVAGGIGMVAGRREAALER